MSGQFVTEIAKIMNGSRPWSRVRFRRLQVGRVFSKYSILDSVSRLGCSERGFRDRALEGNLKLWRPLSGVA